MSKNSQGVLIVGSDGNFGRALGKRLRKGRHEVLETTRKTDTLSGSRIFLDLGGDLSSWKPPTDTSVAFLFTAETSIEKCQSNPIETARINIRQTLELSRSLTDSGVFVVFPSTNLVFDGSVPKRKVTDPVCPRLEYGKQKASTERQLLQMGDLVSVIRFTKVIPKQYSLFEDWRQALLAGESIHPYSDLMVSPVPLDLALDVFTQIRNERLSGITHVSGTRDVSYADIALHIAKHFSADEKLIQAKSASETGLHDGHLPRHTTLDTTRMQRELGLEAPDPWETIDSVLDLP